VTTVGSDLFPVVAAPPTGDGDARRLAGVRERLGDWEDVLALLVDPQSPFVKEARRARSLLSFLLARAGIDEDEFWSLDRARRAHLFLANYSRTSRSVPELELTSFDVEKLLKERYRREPLTIGAAWHHGYWRSYFSHAAITHPANDGLREEFSTAWDIVRKKPAVVFRDADGERLVALRALRLDLPIIVGPLPFDDECVMARAYLRAIAAAEPEHDIRTRSLVVLDADRAAAQTEALAPHAADLMLRLEPRHVDQLAPGTVLAPLLQGARIVELSPGGGAAPGEPGDVVAFAAALERLSAGVRALAPDVLLSVYLRHGEGFWEALEAAAACDGVALVHIHAGDLKSYRLIPRVDAFLKDRLVRARVQLVSAGGDSDTQASAASVYESVLLGANGGAMTHAAAIALVPEIVDVLQGANAALVAEVLTASEPDALREMALCTLTCWQHSILDFLSCMGIDDVQKTSGNTMAITVTGDWVREVDALASDDFAHLNAEINRERVQVEPVSPQVRARHRVSALLAELAPDLPLVNAARVLAQRNASLHVYNTSHALNADFLEVIYRMAAGELPREDDFLIDGGQGPASLDGIGLRLARVSLAWSLERLRRDAKLLDYISLAVPRGFIRPGAVAPRADVSVHADLEQPPLARVRADARGGFSAPFTEMHPLAAAVAGDERPLWLVAVGAAGERTTVELSAVAHGGRGASVLRASGDGAIVLRREPRGGVTLAGRAVREPIWHGPVSHASTSLGAASEDFLTARIEGNAGLTMTSSGEGGPIRLAADADMRWESLQAASGHFGITATDLRKVRDVEIKINQGAKPGKGGRLSGAKVTPTVSKARNIPVGTDALSPDPKHDIYSIEDMPAEVWLWLLYHNHCGIKITGSNYTRFVAAGMWSNFVVDYLLIDAGTGGSGNYHADSSHVGWPDAFRTMLHTHHALLNERVDLDGSGELRPIRDGNGVPFGAQGGTRLLASGGLRGELDMLKVLIAGADGLVEGSISKAVAFGCNQCGNCHLDCPRGGITTKQELTVQNDRGLMRQRFRNWAALNAVKLAVLIDALNRENGALADDGSVARPDDLLDDIRLLRGRTDLLVMPEWETPVDDLADAPPVREGPAAVEHDSCRVGSLAVSEPVTVHAVWEAARVSYNGGNNRGGGIDFAGFAPAPVREATCLIFNTIGPDRDDTLCAMLGHLGGCRVLAADGGELPAAAVLERRGEFRLPVRERYDVADGWRRADLREDPGDFHLFFVAPRPGVLVAYGKRLLASPHWLQRHTKYGGFTDADLSTALTQADAARGLLGDFVADVRAEYFTVLAHIIDSRYYRTHGVAGVPEGKYAAKRRGYLVSMGEDLGAIKISGWTHTIPEYFDFDHFWAGYPGVKRGGVEVTVGGRSRRTMALHAHVWGVHHRYPTNSPALDAEGRGNPAGAHPFKSYNLLLMHNGEQVGVDSTSPFLREFGYVHADATMGDGWERYEGDSVYDRKALTDTEYAAYLVDFTGRVLGLSTEEASQVISPITGLDLEDLDSERRRLFSLLSLNYVQLTPTGPYKFTIIESRGRGADRRVGFRENMDIKFLRPHELVVNVDTAAGGVHAVANGSEAKIADSLIRALHHQGLLKDAGHDLRFNMRPGGNPGRGEFGGVVEVFLRPGGERVSLANRFGEPIVIERAGEKIDLSRPLDRVRPAADWKKWATGLLEEMAAALPQVLAEAGEGEARRLLGPDDVVPEPAARLIDGTLERLATIRGDDYRWLVESALPDFAIRGAAQRALALRVLTELRKRVQFADLGGKALSGVEYVTDGGRDVGGWPEGGIYRLLEAVPPLHEALQRAHSGQLAFDGDEAAPGPAVAGTWGRLVAATRDDLTSPHDAVRDVLVVDFAGFESESFTLDSASRIVSEAARCGWRNIVGYGFLGGPRYVGTNLADAAGAPARGVVIELYGRESGDFLAALLEGAEVWVYGQGQCHVGMKADSGYVFVENDALNTCFYAAHGGTFNTWDSGSRFAVAGQNKVYLDDGETLAPGLKSIHFGSPNEYAFEYLMSGGQNSLHVVMGLAKPDARGRLRLRHRPYAGKFFMSGAAAGRVFVFDPDGRLDPEQYRGNVVDEIEDEEWRRDLAPFLVEEARRRGVPLRVSGDEVALELEGEWRRWHYRDCFVQLVPLRVSRKLAKAGVVPPQLAQMTDEL